MMTQWISLVVIVAGVAMAEVDNTRKLYNGFQVQRWKTLVLDDFLLLYQICIAPLLHLPPYHTKLLSPAASFLLPPDNS